MNEETLDLLEFERVLQIIARETQCVLGRQEVLSLLPVSEEERTLREDLFAEAQAFLREEGRVHCILPEAHALTETLEADRAPTLGPEELLILAEYLSFVHELSRRLLSSTYPRLADVVERPHLPVALLNRIQETFDEKGSIRNTAHPELAQVRQGQTDARRKVEGHLNRLLQGRKSKYLIPEPFVTQRAGRHVIPVRTEHQKQIQGIVHGTSSSGATVFMEPLSAVELNNQHSYYRERESEIIQQVISELSQECYSRREDIREVIEAIGRIDAAFAVAKFAKKFTAATATFTSDGTFQLQQARHPLLLDTLAEKEVKAIDIRLQDESTVLVISGPNTGGKTAALKTAGLLTAMARAGLPVTAEGAHLPDFATVHTDIGDHQSITEHLSTFSAHIARIRKIVESHRAPALILLDELGRGTDPIYGAALAIAVIEHFRKEGSYVLATTHHGSVKAFASATQGVRNASVGLDPEEMQPTYTLEYGIPGGSSGLEIAERLGLPSKIVARARGLLDEKDAFAESYLRQLREDRDRLREREEEWKEKNLEIERRRRQLEASAAEKDKKRTEEFEAQLNRWGKEFRKQAASYLKRIEDDEKSLREKRRLQQREAALKETFRRRQKEQSTPPEEKLEKTDLQPGDTVFQTFFKKKGKVVSIRGSEATLEVEGKTLTSPLSQLRKVERERIEEKPSPNITINVVRDTDPELNIIGKTVAEAMPVLDKYLDRATISKLEEVSIIHGIGTGRLRTAVEDFLSEHPAVESFQVDRGSTRAKLKI